MTIWGNHSATQYPDLFHAEIGGQNAAEVVGDQAWLENDFIPTVAKRGAAIIEARGSSSAASAASATIDAARDWLLGSAEDDWVSMAVVSDGSYGVPEGLISSFPVTTKDGDWEIVQGLEIDDFSRGRIDASDRRARRGARRGHGARPHLTALERRGSTRPTRVVGRLARRGCEDASARSPSPASMHRRRRARCRTASMPASRSGEDQPAQPATTSATADARMPARQSPARRTASSRRRGRRAATQVEQRRRSSTGRRGAGRCRAAGDGRSRAPSRADRGCDRLVEGRDGRRLGRARAPARRRRHGRSRAAPARPSSTMLDSSIARVIGPTPPGFGETQPATSHTSSATSPAILPSTRETPTSSTAAPGLTMSPVMMPGTPAAATTMSALRTWAARSRVPVWHSVTVAFSERRVSSSPSGRPTVRPRPTTTTSAPAIVDVVAAQQLDDADRRARQRPGLAEHQPAEVDRVQAVDVLVGVDARQQRELVEPGAAAGRGSRCRPGRR